jgi:hypothetical protein
MKGGNKMRKLYQKLIDAIVAWLFGPPCNGQCDNCSAGKEEEKEPEQKPKPGKGGFAY